MCGEEKRKEDHGSDPMVYIYVFIDYFTSHVLRLEEKSLL